LLSPFLSEDPPEFPFVALLVSGGHTQLMRVEAVGSYEILGETVDDAAGEAFDKSAKLMGLGYPGGPALSKCAEGGNPQAFKLPRPLMHSGNFDFSFAGLKTSVLTHANKLGAALHDTRNTHKADLAASTEAAIVEVLVKKSMAAYEGNGHASFGCSRRRRRQSFFAIAIESSLRKSRRACALSRTSFVHRQWRHDCHGSCDAGSVWHAASRIELWV